MRQRLELVANAAHQGRDAREAGGNVGAEPGGEAMPVDGAGSLGVGPPDGAEQRRGIGRAASEPGCDGEVLLERDGAELRTGVECPHEVQRPLQQVTTGYTHAPSVIIGERKAELLKD